MISLDKRITRKSAKDSVRTLRSGIVLSSEPIRVKKKARTRILIGTYKLFHQKGNSSKRSKKKEPLKIIKNITLCRNLPTHKLFIFPRVINKMNLNLNSMRFQQIVPASLLPDVIKAYREAGIAVKRFGKKSSEEFRRIIITKKKVNLN